MIASNSSEWTLQYWQKYNEIFGCIRCDRHLWQFYISFSMWLHYSRIYFGNLRDFHSRSNIPFNCFNIMTGDQWRIDLWRWNFSLKSIDLSTSVTHFFIAPFRLKKKSPRMYQMIHAVRTCGSVRNRFFNSAEYCFVFSPTENGSYYLVEKKNGCEQLNSVTFVHVNSTEMHEFSCCRI